MIKKPAAKIAAAAVLMGGLLLSRLAGNGLAGEPDTASALPAPNPAFEIRRRPDRLVLSGSTQSLQHEQDLRKIAESSFPGVESEFNFEPLGISPEYWPDLTAQVLYLLAETVSSTATLTIDTIDIRGITGDDFRWQSRLQAVQDALPVDVALSTDTLTVDRSVDASEICQKAFANFDAGPINFEEATAAFRSSAYPRLQRVIALASKCHQSQITITGHTDASGSEAFNERLSLLRAEAVGDYLVQGGIDERRLQVAGLGSAEPIADNKTRYGRSLNRRIEIELRPRIEKESLLGRR